MVEDRLAAVQALTPRQREILRLAAQNLQVKEIARELNISERTVKTHTDAARRRLGVATTREAARLVVAWDAAQAAAGIVPEGHRPSRTMDETPATEAPSRREHLPERKVSETPIRGEKQVRGDMQAWLDNLNPLQWLGLIVVAAVSSALALTGLIAAVLSTMEALQRVFHNGGLL